MSDPSTKVEAYFEGAENVFEDARVNFNSKKSTDLLLCFDYVKRKNIQNVNEAFDYLRFTAKENDLICVLGSHYFGPHIYKELNKSFANKE